MNSQNDKKYCTYCGAPSDTASKFCTQCGKPFPTTPTSKVVATDKKPETSKPESSAASSENAPLQAEVTPPLKWYHYAWFFRGMDKLAMWCGIIALTTYLITGVFGGVAAVVLGIIELLHSPTERNRDFTIIAMGFSILSAIVLLA